MSHLTKHTASSINEASRLHGENNDCTVRAIAVSTGVDYSTVHTALAKRGRRRGRGAYERQWLPAIKDVGFTYTDVTAQFDGRTCRSIEPELRRKGGTYIVKVARHAVGFDGEKFIDWAAGRLNRVKNVYAITKPGEEPGNPVVKVGVETEDFVFVIQHTKRNGLTEWRIMINENGKDRWLNMKDFEHAARKAAKAAAAKRGIPFVGEMGARA